LDADVWANAQPMVAIAAAVTGATTALHFQEV
jgi:hypothetical protein